MTPASRLPAGLRAAVEVPATSANLGPGFDCFGLALDWRDRIRCETANDGFCAEVSGEGAGRVPTDERHLIVSSVRIGLSSLGLQAPGLRVRSANTIPHGRGLGSSSAAIVAGLAAAWTLAAGVDAVPVDLDRAWLLRHATAIEGHPDNVAAAILGGFVLAWSDGESVRAVNAAVDPRIAAVVWVPATEVATKVARGLLPDLVPHAQAAANAGRAGLLVHALAWEPELLLAGTDDWLHQSYRSSAMPSSYDLVRRLRADGHAAVISGAGPTVLVLTTTDRVADLVARDEPGFVGRGLRPSAGVVVIDDAESGPG
ncbi:MAG TPA: homoserine kinase [Microlunatus sp.]|nr:homoserine kinase [Microlunatus sp.]